LSPQRKTDTCIPPWLPSFEDPWSQEIKRDITSCLIFITQFNTGAQSFPVSLSLLQGHPEGLWCSKKVWMTCFVSEWVTGRRFGIESGRRQILHLF
jgi:hypothetical protein